MSKILTSIRNYQIIRHLVLMWIVCPTLLFGQSLIVNRKPASYIPDDDVIVKPIDNEISFYQQYVAADKSEEVVKSRNQLKIWNDNQIFADQYAMDSTLQGSAFFVPTPEEKWAYFSDKYLRYLRGRGEEPFKNMPKEWFENYRASNEVDTIDEMEKRFQDTTKKSYGGNTLPDSLKAKEVNIWKKTTFIFQPRLDQGLVIVGFKSPIAYARAWVGINGETEINVRQNFESVGLRVMFNYYAHSGRYFSSVDKKLTDNLYARYTSMKDPNHESNMPLQDDSLMLLYAKHF